MRSLKVNLDKRCRLSYEIKIGANILDRAILLIAKNHPAGHYVVITDDGVGPLYGKKMVDGLKEVGLNVSLLKFPAGESSKNIRTAVEIAEKLMEKGADRETMLIALGGGVVGDIAGFAASIFMRGVPYLQVPTTLVAQVDSAIGGKTGVDLPTGKNLLGTFYQPRVVFVSLHFLETLPQKEFQNGLAEIIKYGAIEEERILETLEKDMEAVKAKDPKVMLNIVESCCRIKKSIVEIDEKEHGLRRILNFGHTVGHALESVSKYKMTHGEGVALGMVAAARISEKTGYLKREETQRLETVIAEAGLPVRIPKVFKTEDILVKLRSDKKKKGDAVRFVLLKKIGMPFISGSVEPKMVAAVIEEMKQ
jgi:3-dehydroquinate synthase